MELTLNDIAQVVAEVVASYDIREAYLFGSFARGDYTAASDIDLRFVCGPKITYGSLFRISQDLERRLGRSVEIVTNPPELMRPRFRKQVERDEVLLYEAA